MVEKIHTKKSLPFIAALVMTALAMAGFMFLGSLEKERDLLQYRSHALSQLNASSERLQNILNSSLLPIEGLSAYVSIHPAISKAEFDDFAKQVIAQHKSIHIIQLVKGTVITGYIYPLKGNESAIGVDLMSLPTDRETVRNAIDTKKTVLAGPITLIQGGAAFISRSPIFTTAGKKSQQKDQYWGLAQAIIATETAFKEAGLYDKSSDLSFAIRWKGTIDASGAIFFGDRSIFQANPVILEIQLFNSSWQLAAIPKTGWASISEVSALFKAIRLMISLVLGGLVFVYLRSQQRIIENKDKLKKFENLFSEITDLTYILDTKGNIIFANKMFAEFTGRKPEEFIGRAFAPLFDEENQEKAMTIYENVLRGEAMHFELTFRDTGILCEYKSFPFLDETGKVAGVTGIARNVTERKKAEDHIRQIAYFDSLTELPNRALFLDRIVQAIVRAQRATQILAVLYLDLDNFKLINDTLGHEAGDAALREIAGRLKSCLREMDTVARLGGDEFVFILEEIRNEQDAALVAEKIISVLSTPVLLRGNTYTIGGSIGISVYPEDAPDSDTLINNADIAMYRAKGKGGNNFGFYSAGA